jgi:hypothetical protein
MALAAAAAAVPPAAAAVPAAMALRKALNVLDSSIRWETQQNYINAQVWPLVLAAVLGYLQHMLVLV